MGRVCLCGVNRQESGERGEVVQQADVGQDGGIVERAEEVQQKEDADWIDDGQEQGEECRVNVANVAHFEAFL